MSKGEEAGRSGPLRKARRRPESVPPANIDPSATQATPTVRLELRTQIYIQELQDDKAYFRGRLEELQDEVDRLRPENARLRELVRSTGILDFVSLALITVGGGFISYAAFVESVAKALAAVGLGTLLSGVLLLLVLNLLKINADRGPESPN